MADSFIQQKKSDSAFKYGTLALQNAKKTVNVNDSLVAILSFKLGKYYYDYKKLSQADSLFIDAISVFKACCGEKIPLLAQATYLRGGIALLLNRLDSANTHFLKALSIREDLFGKSHVEVARSLIGMASLALLKQMEDSAANLAERAISIFAFDTIGSDLDGTKALIVLADVRYKQGKFDEALDAYQRAYQQRQKLLGLIHPEVATCLYRLGRTYSSIGDYRHAEASYLLGLKISEALYGHNSYDVGVGLADLAVVEFARGYTENAESNFREAEHIISAARGNEHPSVLAIRQLLAQHYSRVGRHREADSIMQAVTLTIRNSSGALNGQLIECLLVHADIMVSQHNNQKAQAALAELKGLIESELGRFHLRYVQMLQVEAKLKLYLKSFESALQVIDEAQGIIETTMQSHHSTASSLHELKTNCLRGLKLYRQALLEGCAAFEGRRSKFAMESAALPQAELLSFAKSCQGALSELLSTLSDCAECRTVPDSRVIDAILNYHFIASNILYERNELILSDTMGGGHALLAEYDKIRRQMELVVLQRKFTIDSVSLRLELNNLQTQLIVVEKEIAKKYERKIKGNSSIEFSCKEVSRTIPKRSVLIEFFRFDYVTTATDSVRVKYFACVLYPDNRKKLIDLGWSNHIDNAIYQTSTHFDSIASSGITPSFLETDRIRALGGEVRRLIWDPLCIDKDEIDCAFVIPDGAISLISLGVLPDSSNHYLIESLSFNYLTSVRELVPSRYNSESNKNVLVIGDPDFDWIGKDNYVGSHVSQFGSVKASEEVSVLKDGESIDKLHRFSRLAGTRREVNEVADIVIKSLGCQVDVLTDSMASEKNVRELCNGRFLIHIATHGFSNADVRNSKLPSETNTISSQVNALHLCGLAFAGANESYTNGSSTIEDGLLTADEIARLDLRGTRCVVLSSCESGMGTIIPGEGVLGLQRAFALSGASSTIAALWKIPDASTAEFMRDIYKNPSNSLPEAVRTACIVRLKSLRSIGLPDHPYSWGAFIYSGSPISLK